MAVFIASGGTDRVGGHHTRDIFDVLAAYGVHNILVVTYALGQKSGWLAALWKRPGVFVRDKRFTLKTASWSDGPTVLAKQLLWADSLLIVGGNPSLLLDRLGQRLPDLPQHIRAVAGISAGAMVMGEARIAGDHAPRLQPAMGWVQGVVIDVHVAQRKREGRMKMMSASNSHLKFIGLNEYATIVVNESGVLLPESAAPSRCFMAGKSCT